MFVALLATAVLTPNQAWAQKKPIQLALFSPVQIFPPEDTIAGVRLSIYGKNAVVNGVDVGIVNKTTEVSRGVMWGIVGLANDFQGVQSHWVSISKGKFEGWQMGYVNISDTFRGFQSELVNVANADAEGLQLSLVNYAKKFTGLQIGLVNIIEEGGMLLGTGGD